MSVAPLTRATVPAAIPATSLSTAHWISVHLPQPRSGGTKCNPAPSRPIAANNCLWDRKQRRRRIKPHGVNPYHLKLLLNHSLPKSDVTAGYVHKGPEELRPSQQRITDRLREHGLQL